MKFLFALIPFFLFLFFSGCSYLGKTVRQDPFHLGALQPDTRQEAEELIRSLRSVNISLKAYKGVGNLTLRTRDGMTKSRLMWIGETAEKLRLEVIGIHGQPVLSMASDGEQFYIYSLSENKYYKRRIKDNSLQQFLNIPLRLTTISELLMGRIPIFPHINAAIVKNETEDGYLLYVLEDATGHIQKFFLDDTKSDVSKIEYLTSNGSLLYRVMFDERKIIGAFTIPFGFFVSNADGDGLEIDIDRYWVDVSVNPSVFVLHRPE